MPKTMEQTIHRKLTDGLKPEFLNIVNQSHLHQGHAGDNGTGESHFRVEVVSNAFCGMSRVQMHQHVYSLLQDELDAALHALSVDAKVP